MDEKKPNFKNAVESPHFERLLLRKEEIAESLGVSDRTIHDWESKYGFPVIRIGTSVRYSPVIVQEWIRRLHDEQSQ